MHALSIWRSIEALRARGASLGHLGDVVRSMDAVLVRHRSTLVEQYLAVSPSCHQDSRALIRKLGLEYWSDGGLLAQDTHPDGRTT